MVTSPFLTFTVKVTSGSSTDAVSSEDVSVKLDVTDEAASLSVLSPPQAQRPMPSKRTSKSAIIRFILRLLKLISAPTVRWTYKILTLAKKALENSKRRVSTGQLNDLILDCVRASEPPTVNGKRLKIMYVTQAEETPPMFVLFVNEANLMHFSYRRYLENCLRKAYDFSGTPIKIVVRERDNND